MPLHSKLCVMSNSPDNVVPFDISALNPPNQQLGWIGLRDFSGMNTDFRWLSDNSSMIFSNFVPGQPDFNDQHCVYVTFPMNTLGEPGRWRDAECVLNVHAICETERVSDND